MKSRSLDFLISYDISDEKRLVKLSKFMEQIAIRIQRSIFYYPKVSKIDLKNTINKIISIINEDEDDVRIYIINKKTSLSFNNAVDLKNPFILKEIRK